MSSRTIHLCHARTRMVFVILLSLLWSRTGLGWAAPWQRADLGKLYDREAQAPDYLRNPVIVIPGISGSRLVDQESGRAVWGSFNSRDADPRTREGARLIALPMSEHVPLSELRDQLQSDGPLDRLPIRVLGVIPIRVKAYAQILGALGVGGYRSSTGRSRDPVDYGDAHFTCFQFDYDWRRDIAENAARLNQFIVERQAYVKAEMLKRYAIEDADVKFDIVAHSMGGLVARYYLRYGAQPLSNDGSLPKLDWSGGRHVERAILVGTPNAGAAEAFVELLEGSKVAPFVPRYAPAIVGTMPAAYQLLPRPRHGAVVDSERHDCKLDIYDPDLWKRMHWGLASANQDKVLQMLLPDVPDRATRLHIALDHQRKCLLRARQLHQALDVPCRPPPGLSLYLFAGDAIDTTSVVAVDSRTGRTSVLKHSPGDGVTTRASTLMDERVGRQEPSRLISPIRWTSVMFLPTDHLGLTKDAIFTDNVLALLLESP